VSRRTTRLSVLSLFDSVAFAAREIIRTKLIVEMSGRAGTWSAGGYGSELNRKGEIGL
jgi:hypothetical protein